MNAVFCSDADMITAAAAPAKACKLQQPCGVFLIRIWECSSLGFGDCGLRSEVETGACGLIFEVSRHLCIASASLNDIPLSPPPSQRENKRLAWLGCERVSSRHKHVYICMCVCI